MSAPSAVPDLRHTAREHFELEVGVATESNSWVGFTENLSADGIFVATYAQKPIGARVEIGATLPDGATILLPGIVRWIRDAGADGWPGIGVGLERVAPEDESRIRALLALREPIFFDA